MIKFTRTITLVVWVLSPLTSHAHKLNLFTYVESNQVSVEAYFPDGKKARNSEVQILDTPGNVLAKGVTDEQGIFLFTAPTQAALRIVVNAGLGHQAEYELSADEWSDNPTATETINNTSPLVTPPTSATPTSNNPGITVPNPANVELQRTVTQAIKPLALEIAQLRQRTTLADIIGGIGFIVGILGVIAYWKARVMSTQKH